MDPAAIRRCSLLLAGALALLACGEATARKGEVVVSCRALVGAAELSRDGDYAYPSGDGVPSSERCVDHGNHAWFDPKRLVRPVELAGQRWWRSDYVGGKNNWHGRGVNAATHWERPVARLALAVDVWLSDDFNGWGRGCNVKWLELDFGAKIQLSTTSRKRGSGASRSSVHEVPTLWFAPKWSAVPKSGWIAYQGDLVSFAEMRGVPSTLEVVVRSDHPEGVRSGKGIDVEGWLSAGTRRMHWPRTRLGDAPKGLQRLWLHNGYREPQPRDRGRCTGWRAVRNLRQVGWATDAGQRLAAE